MGGAKKKKPGTEKVLVGTRLLYYSEVMMSVQIWVQKLTFVPFCEVSVLSRSLFSCRFVL